jgi:NitT/TauT family transport system permease protein
MMASNEGIGYLLISAGSSMQMGLAFSGPVVIGAMVMGAYELFAIVEKRTIGWAHRRATTRPRNLAWIVLTPRVTTSGGRT